MIREHLRAIHAALRDQRYDGVPAGVIDALNMLAKCDLNEGNCASLAVATRRIQAVARRALNECGISKHSLTEKP